MFDISRASSIACFLKGKKNSRDITMEHTIGLFANNTCEVNRRLRVWSIDNMNKAVASV